MVHNPSKGARIRRYEHSQFLRDTGNRHTVTRFGTVSSNARSSKTASHARPSNNQHAKLAAIKSPASTSFDMLSVEPSPTGTQSSPVSAAATQNLSLQSALRAEVPSSSESFLVAVTSTNIQYTPTPTPGTETEMSTVWDELQQFQVESTSSIKRTTLILPATFSLVVPSSSTLGLVPTPTLGTLLEISGASELATTTRFTSWTRPIPSITYSPSANPSPSSIVLPPTSHSHISPALIAFMAIGGSAALALSLYVFRRVRYKALHVSRSQFQLASSNGCSGSSGVSGSESSKSFVSGGLGRLGQSNKQKGHLGGGDESPLWGGREKFSPQIGHGIIDLPPAAHLNERMPPRRRRSLMDTLRRNAPGRPSKYGHGWNAIPDVPSVPSVPTFKITEADTNHRRGGSGSSFSESPDPNLASIQVASVTRTLSATASYRGSPLPRPTTSLEYPRPAPKVPPKAILKTPPRINVPEQIPPVPKIPDIPGLATHLSGQKKHTDVNGRGKIAVTDISKPRPVMPVKPELTHGEVSRTAGEADPMAMYARYSAGLGVRNDPPEPIRRETSMAKKIAQIANSNTKSTIASTVSHSSLSNRDTRALAAAAGVTGPILNEEISPLKSDKKSVVGSSSSLSTPGLGEVGNVMLRPFGQLGSMIPLDLETPAIGLDGRSSYLSTNLGSEAGWCNQTNSSAAAGSGPKHAIAAKPAVAAGETDVSTLAVSIADDSDRRTIMSAYSQDFMPLSQEAHMRQNPDYRSPTYSIYNYYGPDRTSRMPSMIHGEDPEIGGAM